MSHVVSQFPKTEYVLYASAAGFVAGLVMMVVAMSTTVIIGMPYDTIPKAIGAAFGFQNYLVVIGLGMHLLTSTLVGVIFGLVISKVNKLQITGYKKGLGMGLIAGMVAFVAISIPMSNLVLPPILVKFMTVMHPNMSQQMAMTVLQQKKILIMSTAILRHLVYGILLGAITSALVLRKQIALAK